MGKVSPGSFDKYPHEDKTMDAIKMIDVQLNDSSHDTMVTIRMPLTILEDLNFALLLLDWNDDKPAFHSWWSSLYYKFKAFYTVAYSRYASFKGHKAHG